MTGPVLIPPSGSSRILVSVVSHRQRELADGLLSDLASLGQPGLRVVYTANLPEPPPSAADLLGARLSFLSNTVPKGFAANHNSAFASEPCDYFCVANPDIRLQGNPFPPLLDTLRDPAIALAAPLVLAPDGEVEDSARRFPTFGSLTRKALREFARRPRSMDYVASAEPFDVDWSAGMFMLLRSGDYASSEGFDERFFLYYEDVDLCARLRLAGKRVVVQPSAQVIHDARRESRRSLRHAWWHARSIFQYFRSETYRALRAENMV